MVSTVILALIAAIVVIAVGGSMAAATGVTLSTKNSVSARAAADAGLNWVLGELNRGYFLCNSDQRDQDPAFTVHVAYRDAGNVPVADCGSGTVSADIASATVTSTGYAAPGSPASHAIGAEVQITLATSGSELNHALFTEGAFNLANDSVVEGSAPGALDGDIYTNGSFECRTQNRIEGSIVALGNLDFYNTCAAAESLWGGGNMNFHDSTVRLSGDVVAAGGITLGKAWVAGDVIANGNITLGNAANFNCGSGPNVNVCGSIVSLNGSVTLGQNGSPVAGGIFARGTVNLNYQNQMNPQPTQVVSLTGNVTHRGVRVSGTVAAFGSVTADNAGTINAANTCTLTPSAFRTCAESELSIPVVSAPIATFTPEVTTTMGTRTQTHLVAAPPRQSFPQINSDEASLASYWEGWVRVDVPATDQMCQSSNGFKNGMAALLASVPTAQKTLVVFGCTSRVDVSNPVFDLRGNLALMSRVGFQFSNEAKVNSPAQYGGPYSLLLIAPSDSPGVTWEDVPGYPGHKRPVCSTANPPDIRFDNKVIVDSRRPQIFMYSPCTVYIRNKGNGFDGQIYSGVGDYPSGVIIRRAIMTVPGAIVPNSPGVVSESSARLVSRYDIG